MSLPDHPARFVSFNLEPTFRCNLEGEMCPRFSSEDPHPDMSMESSFRRGVKKSCSSGSRIH